jgi:hypothetical protein
VKAIWLAAVAVAACVTGCMVTGPKDPAVRAQCPKLLDPWFHKAPGDVSARLPSQSLETQYAVYLCGTQYVHPPAKYLAGTLASSGEPMVRFLRQKLNEHPDDLTVHDIVRVFEMMQWRRTYDVRADTPLMALLHERVQALDDSQRAQTEVMLDSIVRDVR